MYTHQEAKIIGFLCEPKVFYEKPSITSETDMRMWVYYCMCFLTV